MNSLMKKLNYRNLNQLTIQINQVREVLSKREFEQVLGEFFDSISSPKQNLYTEFFLNRKSSLGEFTESLDGEVSTKHRKSYVWLDDRIILIYKRDEKWLLKLFKKIARINGIEEVIKKAA